MHGVQHGVRVRPSDRIGRRVPGASPAGRLPGVGPCGVGRAARASVSKLRRAATVHDQSRRAGHGHLRLLRQPVHSPSAPGGRRPEGRQLFGSSARVRRAAAPSRWLGTRWRARCAPTSVPFTGTSVSPPRRPGGWRGRRAPSGPQTPSGRLSGPHLRPRSLTEPGIPVPRPGSGVGARVPGTSLPRYLPGSLVRRAPSVLPAGNDNADSREA